MQFEAACYIRVMTRVLVSLVQDEICILFYQLLHAILHKLIEGVELLSDQPLLHEEAGDDSPTIFLCDVFTVLIIVWDSIIGWILIGYRLWRRGSGYDKRREARQVHRVEHDAYPHSSQDEIPTTIKNEELLAVS
jgi:hypothetical protein